MSLNSTKVDMVGARKDAYLTRRVVGHKRVRKVALSFLLSIHAALDIETAPFSMKDLFEFLFSYNNVLNIR
jgi:hypothetical protein